VTYDLVIRNGFVVDGSGLPQRKTDVGIKDGRIAAVGHLGDIEAAEEIDAEGLVVAPGIIDAHTHYDPQLTFEPYATSSCYHGVTTVVAGNCGFSLAPCKEGDRDFVTRLFAKVEGMSPVALGGVSWDFETFPEFLVRREGGLGVNLACYVGHSSLRRWVMGDEASGREATDDEVEQMRLLLREALDAGAAGFSSSHSPTQLDGDDRPVPSRLASRAELLTLVTETGRTNAGSISYLPKSAVGGLDAEDKQLLIDLALASRLPIVIQGLGGKSKVDAPTDWPDAKAFLDEARAQGAAVYSLLRSQPFDRPFTLAAGTSLYDGVPAWRELLVLPVEEKLTRLRDDSVRAELRQAVDNPNTDPAKGSTLPPPKWEVVVVSRVGKPENEKYLRRSIADVAAEQGVAPADAMLDLALSEDLQVEFRWSSENPGWIDAVADTQHDPHLIIGVSDGGAHLDRDDGSEWSTYFLRSWVLDRKVWTLEEGIRQITQIPAGLCGFGDRGLLHQGYWADVMIFDPETIALDTKGPVADFPGGEARFSARPKGVHYTIVNGTVIVRDGELTGALPGRVLKPS
jgi:N-acyl-D-amino-acid deacylase